MVYSPLGGFDFIITLVPIIVILGFILVFGFIIVSVVKGGAEWNKNNNSPVLTVAVKVVAKRMSVSHHSHQHGDNAAMHHTGASTTYYVTFEVESGDRMELRLPDNEYGLIAEGDSGKLTFQGTRYKRFERYSTGLA